MKILVTVATLAVGQFLTNSSPAFSQEQWRLLTPAQTTAYHACLTAAWIAGFCRGHAWGLFASYDRTYSECILANGGGRYALDVPPFSFNTEDDCWHRARGLLP